MNNMNNWNDKKSYDINLMSKEQLNEAMIQWAEGSEELFELLRLCYDKGIITTGCHIGKSNSYISIIINNHKQILSMIQKLNDFPNSQVCFSSDGGNPFSGDIWHIPSLLLGGPSDFFGSLTVALKNETTEILTNDNNFPYYRIIEFYHLMQNRRCFITVRIVYLGHEDYRLSFEFFDNSSNPRSKYLISFFENLGCITIKNGNHCSMEITSHSIKDFQLMTNKILKALKTSFYPPVFFDKNCFNEVCIEFLDTYGIEEVKKFISEN